MRVGTYREDGGAATVEILSDTSDEKWSRYKLKILDVDAQPYIGGEWKIGEEYDVEQLKGVAFGGMWHLRDVHEREVR